MSRTIYEGGSGEIIEKKSRFIANTLHVETEDEAEAFIESIRKKHWDARHNCYAFVVGTAQKSMRSSDDGEPSGTAGRPILDVICGDGLTDTVIVVTRYFGGVLLGTGGLVRAYSGAAREGIKNSKIIEKKPGIRTLIKTDYTAIGKIQNLMSTSGLYIINSEYTDIVKLEVVIPEEEFLSFSKKLSEATSGRCVPESLTEVLFGIIDGKLIL